MFADTQCSQWFLLAVCSFISLCHQELSFCHQLSVVSASLFFPFLSLAFHLCLSPHSVFFPSLFLRQRCPRLLKPPHSHILLHSLYRRNIFCQEPSEVNSIHPALFSQFSPLQFTSSPDVSPSASTVITGISM